MAEPKTISVKTFLKKFPNEESARIYFENKRWSGEAACPHCGSKATSLCKDHKPMPYRCKSCRKHFSVRTGTALAESRLPLHKWLLAMHLLTTPRNELCGAKIAAELEITQKSARFLASRIQECWMESKNDYRDDEASNLRSKQHPHMELIND